MAFEDMFHHPDMAKLLGLAEEAEKRMASGSGSGSKIEWLNIETGDTYFAVCPPWSATSAFHKMIFKHWKMGPSNGDVVYCPEATEPQSGFRCPVCFVINLMIANGQEQGINATTFRRQGANGQVVMNVVPLIWQDNNLVPKDNPPKAHILRGPSRLADWLYKEGKRVIGMDGKPDFFDPTRAMAVKVTRAEANNRTTYDFNWAPTGPTGRVTLIQSHDEAESFAKSIWDLDRIFGNSWNDDEWTRSVDLALKFMQIHRFRPLPVETMRTNCPPPGRAKKRQQGDAPAPAPTSPSVDLQEIVIPGTAVQPPVTLVPTPAPAPPVVVLQEIIRDPLKIDPETGKQFCFGNQSSDPVCTNCEALRLCVMETIKRVQSGAR